MLLDQLCDDVNRKTELMLGFTSQSQGDNVSTSSASSDTVKEAGNGFFDAFKFKVRDQRFCTSPYLFCEIAFIYLM